MLNPEESALSSGRLCGRLDPIRHEELGAGENCARKHVVNGVDKAVRGIRTVGTVDEGLELLLGHGVLALPQALHGSIRALGPRKPLVVNETKIPLLLVHVDEFGRVVKHGIDALPPLVRMGGGAELMLDDEELVRIGGEGCIHQRCTGTLIHGGVSKLTILHDHAHDVVVVTNGFAGCLHSAGEVDHGQDLAFLSFSDVGDVEIRHIPASKDRAPLIDALVASEGLAHHGISPHRIAEVNIAILGPVLSDLLERSFLGTVVHARTPRCHVGPKHLEVLCEVLVSGRLGRSGDHRGNNRLVDRNERILVHGARAVEELEVHALALLVEIDAVDKVGGEGHLLAGLDVNGRGGTSRPDLTLRTLIQPSDSEIGHSPSLLEVATPLEAALGSVVLLVT